LHDGIKNDCDVDMFSPADVPLLLNSLCDINNTLNEDSIKSVWSHLLLRSDEWYAAAAEFAVVPAFGTLLRPSAAAQCCYLVDDETRMPASAIAALESNGVASLQFSSLILNPSTPHPRWLSKVFLGHRGSELVIALRDAARPGRFQDAEECNTLKQFFFSELKHYGEEWGEASRYACHLSLSPISRCSRLALKQLPIHKMGTLHSSKSLTPCGAVDDDGILVGPTSGNTPVEPSWLNGSFVITCSSDDEAGYDSLRIPSISAAQWYTHHFFPAIDELDAATRVAALQRLLDNLHALDADRSFTEFLKKNGTRAFAFLRAISTQSQRFLQVDL
jgi:hypothetical protein